MAERRIIGTPLANNENLKNIIRRAKIDAENARKPGDFRKQILEGVTAQSIVLDCGRSSRDYFEKIKSKVELIETLDINDFDDYPDLICDLCQEIEATDLLEEYDVIICNAVLEHCYDPFTASKNLMAMLKTGGTLYGSVPFIYPYHAPDSLKFQDYMRFSRDGLAYLFRDASEIRLIPIRGRLSAAMNFLVPSWKKKLERKMAFLNPFLDRFFDDRTNMLQSSGYAFIVRK